jgi:hypothetical protein
LDSFRRAWTGRPKIASNDSFWYPTEQTHHTAGVRFASTSGQPQGPSATVTVPLSLSQLKSVPQFALAAAK